MQIILKKFSPKKRKSEEQQADKGTLILKSKRVKTSSPLYVESQ